MCVGSRELVAGQLVSGNLSRILAGWARRVTGPSVLPGGISMLHVLCAGIGTHASRLCCEWGIN